MKKIIGLAVCFAFILIGCNAKKEEVPKEENNAKKMQQTSKVNELKKKSDSLVKEGKIAEAISVIDQAIELGGENRGILGTKYELLMQIEKYDQALVVALKRDEVAKRKSPWNCISIIEAYLKLNNEDKALEYLKIAIVDRKYNNLNHLKGDLYKNLQENEKFLALLENLKETIGIGIDALDFSVKLVDGTVYKLSDHRGKVVLIDFWATWCPPCRKELPFIKELYAELKEKGFEIIGISLDTDEGKHQSFIKEKSMGWDLTCSGKGWYDDIVKLYNVSSIPSTWIVDKSGKLRYFDVQGEELAKVVKELIEESVK